MPSEVEHFKQFYEEAYLYIEQALTLEEHADSKAAIQLYEKGLLLIDQALSIRTNGDDRAGPYWKEAEVLQQKMRRTRLEVLERLSNMRLSPSPSMSELPGEPPSYEETMKWDAERHPESMGAVPHEKNARNFQDKVREMNALPRTEVPQLVEIPPNAQLMFTMNDVQIFFISPDGYVTAPSYPTALSIFKFEAVEASAAAATTSAVPAFLQVGEWIFPLIPGQSPVLQTNYGAYLFPDTSRQQAGAAVGVLFPDDTDEAVRTVFEHVLCELTVVRGERDTVFVRPRISRRISEGIVKGAEVLARGVGYGAEMTSKLVHVGARKLREQITPVTESPNIDPRMRDGLHVARDVSGVAVRVSGFFVRKIGDATMSLGRYLAPHIRKHGTNLLSKALNESPTASSSKIDDVLEVASGGLRGFATVFLGLESAARVLASSLANETVGIVNHKYGAAAGDVTDSALHTVGNVASTAYNVNACGVKGIAKKTAKNAAVALVEGHEAENMQPNGNAQMNGANHKEKVTEEIVKKKENGF